MSVHRVYARALEARLQEFDINFQASLQAQRATVNSAKAVKRAVEDWVALWSAGG